MKNFPALSMEHLVELRVSAASSLVCQEGVLFLIADDEVLLQSYALDGCFLGEHRLLDESWPLKPKARKAVKADFEMLCQLPDGCLLALGSGSTEKRRRAVLWRPGQVRVIDLAPLYCALEQRVAELNLEGAQVDGNRLLLAQRGNGQGRSNALISLDLTQVMAQLAKGRLDDECLLEVVPVDLGLLDGVPLGFTDLCMDIQGRLLFSAAAEDGQSTYADGQCVGSAIGWLEDGQIKALWTLAGLAKVEGICMVADGSLRLVNDPDDVAFRAVLYRLDLPDF